MYRNRKYRSGTLSKLISADKSSESEFNNVDTAAGSSKDQPPAKISRICSADTVLNDENEVFSQFSIPASQAPSQRKYISQRNNLAISQAATSSKRIPINYFESMLLKCGVNLDNPNVFILNCDSYSFVNKLKTSLKSNPDFPNNLRNFFNGLKEAVADENNVIKLLGGCVIDNQNLEVNSQTQDSLIKLLLFIDFLQKDLIIILADILKEYVREDSLNNHLVCMILSQLKFIDQISHGDMVYEKLFEAILLASTSTVQVVIKSFEDVLDMVKHDDAVKKIVEIIPDVSKLLTPSNIDTFGNMCLSSNVLELLRSKIVTYINNGCSLDVYPSLIKFMLKYNNDEHEELPELVKNVRNCLDWKYNDNTIDAQQLQKNVINYVARSLTKSRLLFNTWVKSVQCIATVAEHKPIDFIIIFIAISINEEKSNYLENILKKKIKQEVFNIQLLKDSISEFGTALVEYQIIILEFIDVCFSDKDILLHEFGCTAYIAMYEMKNSDRKLILGKLVGFASRVTKARIHFDLTTRALDILTYLNRQYPVDILTNSTQLCHILDNSNELTLCQYRLVMNLLCSIAHSNLEIDCANYMKDHVDMLVKKQVSSSILSVKKHGIIGVVREVHHLVWLSSEKVLDHFDSENTINSISELPVGSGYDAANLTNLMMTSSEQMKETMALCYDELAAEFSPRNKPKELPFLDKYFLIWICDTITNNFQNNFVLEEVPSCGDIPFSNQYCINTPEDNDNQESEVFLIAINIGASTLNPRAAVIESVEILAPLFGIVRVLQYHRYDGNLESINALLGCAILLPSRMATEEDIGIFNDHDEIKSQLLFDIYFHLANWFREIISAFASQKDKAIRVKVLKRITDLINLENKIEILLKLAPADYKPPISNFIKPIDNIIPIAKPRKPITAEPKKRAQNVNAANNTVEENIGTLPCTMKTQDKTTGNIAQPKSSKPKKGAATLKQNHVFRQMDPDIMLLLDENLKLEKPLKGEHLGNFLGLSEFKFIIEDLVYKVESITGVKKFNVDQPNQYVVSPSDLMSDMIHFLPKIDHFYNMLMDHLRINLETYFGQKEHENMVTDEMNCTKLCFGLCVRLFAALFTWPGFTKVTHNSMLRKALLILSKHENSDSEEVELNDLALKILMKMCEFNMYVPDIKSAVHIFHLYKALASHTNSSEAQDLVVLTCKEFLSQMWYTFEGSLEHGAQFNLYLEELLKGLIRNINLSTIRDYLKSIYEEISDLRDKISSLSLFPSFNKANWPLLFRALCMGFVTSLQTKLEQTTANKKQFKIWEKSCTILNGFLQIVKAVDNPKIFSIFLKYSHLFFKLFLQSGMAMLEICLKVSAVEATDLLKTLQHTTRFLHNLCCHSKAIKNRAIVMQIPFIRQTVENLVYRVKAALAAHQCSSAFWMGNLKNKDLHGEVILSQIPQTVSNSSQENVEDDNETEDDDSLDDATNDLTNDTTSANSSRSKCF